MWVVDDQTFAEHYARAKLAQADYFAEEILAIADEGSNDWMQREVEAGRIITVPDHEHINRSKLRVDARRWLMSKMAPKKYGDVLRHTDADGGSLAKHLQQMNQAQLLAWAQGVAAEARALLEGPVIEHEPQDGDEG